MNHSKHHKSSFSRLKIIVVLFPLMLTMGCGGSTQISDTENPYPVKPDTLEVPTAFHADNDIAMIVGSMADALTVWESFNPEVYNFSGVLTDGSGAPLYIDKNRNPGSWTVKVETPSKAVITNLDEGDLIASDIVDYLTACLHITSSPIEVTETKRDGVKLEFALPRGILFFHAPAPNAMEGSKIKVIVTDSL